MNKDLSTVANKLQYWYSISQTLAKIRKGNGRCSQNGQSSLWRLFCLKIQVATTTNTSTFITLSPLCINRHAYIVEDHEIFVGDLPASLVIWSPGSIEYFLFHTY